MPSRESAETRPAVANIPDKCRAIEQAIELATTNSIKIDGTEEFGNLKSRFYEFFQQNRVIKDLYPYSFFERDNHHSTSGLLKAIPLAKARITATHENARLLLDEIAPLMAKAKKVQNVGIDKREAKRQALALIEADRTGTLFHTDGPAYSYYRSNRNWLGRTFRSRHTSSKVLADALRLLEAPADPGAVYSLILQLDLLSEKTTTKNEINKLLSTHQDCFGDLRVRKWIRVAHTPMFDLIDLLMVLTGELEGRDGKVGLTSRKKHQEDLDELEKFRVQLERRKSLKEERDRCAALAKRLGAELRQEQKHERQLLKKIQDQIDAEQNFLKRERIKSLEVAFSGGIEETKLLRAAEQDRRIKIAIEVVKEFNPAFEPDELDGLVISLREGWESLTGWTQLNLLANQLLREEFELNALEQLTGIHAFDKVNASTQELRDQASEAFTDVKSQFDESKSSHLAKRSSYETLLYDQIQFETTHSLLVGTNRIPPGLKSSPTPMNSPERSLRVTTEAAIAKGEALLGKLNQARARNHWQIAGHGTIKANHRAKLKQLTNQRVNHEIALSERNQVRLFIQERLDTVSLSLQNSERLWKEYRDTKTVVLTIRTGDDVRAKLKGIAGMLCGGNSGPDAMGKLKVFLMIEAGVRAGYDFGFANLSAEVGAALGIGGTMAVTDSREISFTFHVSVFLTAKAEASIQLNQVPIGETLPIPDLLVESSAKCSLNLFDYRGAKSYLHEDHWASHWSFAIAERIAFLNSVKLTATGFEAINKEWLQNQLKVLGNDPSSHSWLKESIRNRAIPARNLSFKLTSGRFAGEVGVSAGSFEREKVVGSKASATFSVSSNNVKIGTVEEDSVDYKYVKAPKKESTSEPGEEAAAAEPPAYLGFSTYHVYKHEGSTPEHRYLEVEEHESNTAKIGDVELSNSTTTNRGLASIRPGSYEARRKIGYALDVLPGAGYTHRIESPPKMVASFQRPSLGVGPQTKPERPAEIEKLERIIRFRLDVLAAQGEPSTLERLHTMAKTTIEQVDSLAEKATKAEDSVSNASTQANETLDSLQERARSSAVPIGDDAVESLRATIHGALAQAETVTQVGTDLASKYTSAKESIAEAIKEAGIEFNILTKSKNVYTRYFESKKVTLGSNGTRVEWKSAWVPQVYRGLNRNNLSFAASQSIPIVPAFSVYFRESLQVTAVSSAFEIVGFDTFSYLKMLYNACLDRPAFWEAFEAQHKGEVFELCQRAADPTSTAFAELAYDALHGADILKSVANALGRAAWSFFNRRENPFDDGLTEAKLLRALQPKVARERTPAPGDTPYLGTFVPPIPKPNIPAEHAAFQEGFMAETLQTLQQLNHDGLESMKRSNRTELTSARPNTLMENYSAAPTTLNYSFMSQSAARLLHLQPVMDRLSSRSAKPRLGKEECIQSELDDIIQARIRDINRLNAACRPLLSNLKTPSLSGRSQILREIKAIILGEWASLDSLHEWTERWLEAPNTFRIAEFTHSDSITEDSLNDLKQATLERIQRACLVPSNIDSLEEWVRKSKEGISFFMSRSSGTKKLDEAIAAYHLGYKFELDALAPKGGHPVSLARQIQNSFMRLHSIGSHFQTLLNKSLEWSEGRDPQSSRRMPHVVTYIELPARRSLMRIAGVSEVVKTLLRVIKLQEFYLYIEEAVHAYEEHAARTIEHAWQVRERDKRMKAAHLAKSAARSVRANSAARTIQGAWRAKRARTMPARRKEVVEALMDYLAIGHEQFKDEALALGRQKELAPGQKMAVVEVEWEVEESSPPAQSIAPNVSSATP
ncbi:MAG: hypothetical protein HOK28_10310 [Deltaproteobacteria bacterium]|nr:hypothetical protein [Deltaproteobacteria bacterium]